MRRLTKKNHYNERPGRRQVEGISFTKVFRTVGLEKRERIYGRENVSVVERTKVGSQTSNYEGYID